MTVENPQAEYNTVTTTTIKSSKGKAQTYFHDSGCSAQWFHLCTHVALNF